MNNQIKNEIIEKLEKGLDDYCVIIKIGDLREIIPDLSKLLNNHSEQKSQKLIPITVKPTKIVEDNEIITLSELELRLIYAALEKTNGSLKNTALELGISIRDLYRKLDTYKINHKDYAKKSKNNK